MPSARSLSLLVIVLLLYPACTDVPADPEPSGGTEGVVAFEDVSVVPLDQERVLAEQTVLVEDGVIAAMGSAGEVDVPDEALRVEGGGRYLMPGLAEMHAHLPGDEGGGFRDDVLFLFVANGVTFARGMQGAPDHPDLREAIARGERIGPRLRVASPSFGGSDLTEEQARERVRSYHEEGYDLLKVSEGLRPEVYDAIVEEAHERGLPFAGHVSDDVGLLATLEAGQRTIDHLDNYVEALGSEQAPDDYGAIFGAASVVSYAERDRLPELVEATRAARTGMVPTMVVWAAFFSDAPVQGYRERYPELAYLPEEMVENWENALENIRGQFEPETGREVVELRKDLLQALHEADVPILLGSDAPQIFNVPGFSIHHEMQYMQDEVGMSPFEVLVSGSRAVAEFYDARDTFGTVEPGQRADLLLVNGNPLEDVAHAADLDGVMVQGRWLGAEDIEAGLAEIEERYARE